MVTPLATVDKLPWLRMTRISDGQSIPQALISFVVAAEMFANSFQKGFFSLLYSIGSQPLEIWDREVSKATFQMTNLILYLHFIYFYLRFEMDISKESRITT